MSTNPTISVHRLKELLDYDKDNGTKTLEIKNCIPRTFGLT